MLTRTRPKSCQVLAGIAFPAHDGLLLYRKRISCGCSAPRSLLVSIQKKENITNLFKLHQSVIMQIRVFMLIALDLVPDDFSWL